jgi:hypothetical protein
VYSYFLSCRVSEKKKDDNASSTVAASEDGKTAVVYNFDQIERHQSFWNYLRDKEWQSVATFIDKKVRDFCFYFSSSSLLQFF